MKKRIGRVAGFFGHFFGIMITVALLLSLVCQCAAELLRKENYVSAMANPELVEMQLDIIHKEIDAQADKWGFDREKAAALFTADDISEYAEETAAFVTDCLITGGAEAEQPWWDDAALIKMLKADENLQSTVEKSMMTAVVRDDISAKITDKAEKACFPFWGNIGKMAITMVSEKLPFDYTSVMTNIVPHLPAALALLAGICLVLMLIFLHRKISETGKYLGAALISSGLMFMGAVLAVVLSPVGSFLTSLSPTAQLWLASLGSQIVKLPLICAAGNVVCGILLMAVRQHCRRKEAHCEQE